MKDNDPVNIEYSNIIHGMDAEELEAIQKRAFEAEVEACAKEITEIADMLAEHFDVFITAAALHQVWQDYNAAVGDDE